MGTKKSKLFILGNGFDIAHELPTHYSQFRCFLEQLQSTKPDEFNNHNRVSVISYFDDVCEGKDWKDIEYALGLYPLFLEDYNPKIDCRTEKKRYVFFQSFILLELIDSFVEWANSISVENVKPKTNFAQIIQDGDFAFLTFNYTPILEQIYKIPEDAICHIHGKQGGNVVMGHSQRDDASLDLQLLDDVAPYLRQEFFKLFKNPIVNIRHNQAFFDSLTNLSEIYSYGFSFSAPDREYIKLICEKTTKNTMWYLSSYGADEVRKEYAEIIYDSGFCGSISTFTI